ncbi:MAG: hypothetical protein HC779_00370 [Phyllobacteriaceae bacterium]|nr:hypothetical protein [Phyllobacteriaceae bacterium]
MDQSRKITASTINAILKGNTVNFEERFKRIDDINKALGSQFNATEYMTANKNAANFADGDPAKAALHYITRGNAEGRPLNQSGLVLGQPGVKAAQKGDELLPGQTLISRNGKYFTLFRTNGNLVVFKGTPANPGEKIWESGTAGKARNGSVAIQDNGNLVIRDSDGKVQWASRTGASGADRSFKLVMQNNGNLALVDPSQGGDVLWGSISGRKAKAEANEGTATGWSDAQALAYIASYQDLVSAFGTDAASGRLHYNQYGANEGRQTVFNAGAYMAANPDVAAWAANDPAKATQHYISWGVWEGRSPGAGLPALDVPLDQRMAKLPWLALSYTASYPDLMNALGADPAAAVAHYNAYGAAEGRVVSFNPWSYMAANPDVAAWAGGDAMKAIGHFMQYGRFERRATAPGEAARAPDIRPASTPETQETSDAGLVSVGPSITSTVSAYAVLRANQFMASRNGKFFAVMQPNGNLVVFRGTPSAKGEKIWASGTNGEAKGGAAYLQANGDLAVFDTANRAQWRSGTNGNGVNRAFTLVMQNDGNLVVFDSQGGEALWSSMSGRISRPEANNASKRAA